jgi:hypothetical protein
VEVKHIKPVLERHAITKTADTASQIRQFWFLKRTSRRGSCSISLVSDEAFLVSPQFHIRVLFVVVRVLFVSGLSRACVFCLVVLRRPAVL